MYEILIGVVIFTFGIIYGIILNEHATMHKEIKTARNQHIEGLQTSKIDDTEKIGKVNEN